MEREESTGSTTGSTSTTVSSSVSSILRPIDPLVTDSSSSSSASHSIYASPSHRRSSSATFGDDSLRSGSPSSSPSTNLQYSPESLLLQDAAHSAETRRLTLQRSHIPQTVSQMLFTTPGRKSLLGHRRRFSTLAERTTTARTAGNSTAIILQFYILYSIFSTLAMYSIPYGTELSTLLILIGLYSSFVNYGSTTGSIRVLNSIYDTIAVPLLGYYGNKLVDGLHHSFMYVVNNLSPILRSLYVYTIYLSLPYTSVKRITDLENRIQESRGDINYEKHQRRLAEIRGNNSNESSNGGGE